MRSQGPGEWILDLVTVTGCSEQEEGGVECLFPAWGCGSPESSTNTIRVSEVFTPSWGGDPVVETAGNRGSLKANPRPETSPKGLEPPCCPSRSPQSPCCPILMQFPHQLPIFSHFTSASAPNALS